MFFPYQGRIFLVLYLLLFFFIFKSLLTPRQFQSSTPQKSCEQNNGNLCEVGRIVFKQPQNYFLNTWVIARNNIIAEYKVVSSGKYFLVSPIIDLYLVGNSLGESLRKNYRDVILKVLFPHGLIELSAVVLTLSLYYSVIIAPIKSIFITKSFRWILQKLLSQTTLIIMLFLLSGFLEALQVYLRNG